MRKLLGPAGLVMIAVVGVGCAPAKVGSPGASAGSSKPAPSTTSRVQTASSTTAPQQTSMDPSVARWPTFTSANGGYRLRYPPGWQAKESTGDGGPVLSLLPPKGAGISLLVAFTAPPGAGAGELPNTRCHPVRIGGLAGLRCLDTISMSVSTTLQGRHRWYVLTTSLRRPPSPAKAYDRVLASFRLT